jgi:hypothetical protein
MTKGAGQQGEGAALHKIAEKVRDLARQTWIAEAREELFDLADNLDRMAERVKAGGG